MLVLTGYFDLSLDHVADGIALARELALDCADAPGCLQLSFAIDVVQAGRLHLIECWTDDESLARHLETGATQRFRQRFSTLCVNEAGFRRSEAVDVLARTN